ncbi:hypothetical protein ACSSS7_008031 [Eimeria intestinalis]
MFFFLFSNSNRTPEKRSHSLFVYKGRGVGAPEGAPPLYLWLRHETAEAEAGGTSGSSTRSRSNSRWSNSRPAAAHHSSSSNNSTGNSNRGSPPQQQQEPAGLCFFFVFLPLFLLLASMDAEDPGGPLIGGPPPFEGPFSTGGPPIYEEALDAPISEGKAPLDGFGMHVEGGPEGAPPTDGQKRSDVLKASGRPLGGPPEGLAGGPPVIPVISGLDWAGGPHGLASWGPSCLSFRGALGGPWRASETVEFVGPTSEHLRLGWRGRDKEFRGLLTVLADILLEDEGASALMVLVQGAPVHSRLLGALRAHSRIIKNYEADKESLVTSALRRTRIAECLCLESLTTICDAAAAAAKQQQQLQQQQQQQRQERLRVVTIEGLSLLLALHQKDEEERFRVWGYMPLSGEASEAIGGGASNADFGDVLWTNHLAGVLAHREGGSLVGGPTSSSLLTPALGNVWRRSGAQTQILIQNYEGVPSIPLPSGGPSNTGAPTKGGPTLCLTVLKGVRQVSCCFTHAAPVKAAHSGGPPHFGSLSLGPHAGGPPSSSWGPSEKKKN